MNYNLNLTILYHGILLLCQPLAVKFRCVLLHSWFNLLSQLTEQVCLLYLVIAPKWRHPVVVIFRVRVLKDIRIIRVCTCESCSSKPLGKRMVIIVDCITNCLDNSLCKIFYWDVETREQSLFLWISMFCADSLIKVLRMP